MFDRRFADFLCVCILEIITICGEKICESAVKTKTKKAPN
jgi:hypothetical protein